MEIKIQMPEDDTVILSDDRLDTRNFVTMYINDEEVDIPLDELHAAVEAFVDKRDWDYQL